ncbi:MAG: cyclic beta 1-2 glucan synthetase [Desulfovibrionaceae bacterium]|nr:cyclic beta 1-2 glucan synthetase [Desulfovibrionaceae bacterium]
MSIVPVFTPAWQRFKTGFLRRRAARRIRDSEPVLRAELFSAERMEKHGRELAQSHRLLSGPHRNHLLTRLADNEAVLAECCAMFRAVNARPRENRRITPAGEWLVDNSYLIGEQIRTARRHLPPRYSRELPRVAAPARAGTRRLSQGLPRVYDIVLENISHSDGRLDSQALSRFVAAYQTVTPLTLGELWAIPIMARLALLENLRRVAARVMSAWRDHALAVDWADRMLEVAERERKNVVLSVAEMASSSPPLSSAFVAEFARRLQGQNSALTLPLAWVEERLAESGSSIEAMIQRETQQQAADQVSVSNTITSLRHLSAVDWRAFVEELSLVESILREDPAGVYPAMNFVSRDHYRHLVEKMSRRARLPEQDVARAAVELARQASPDGGARRPAGTAPPGGQPSENAPEERLTRHVGFYLMGDGRPLLRKAAGMAERPALLRAAFALTHALRANPLPLYLGAALILTLLSAWPFAAALAPDGHGEGLPLWLLVPVCLIFALPASSTALSIVNRLALRLTPPAFLPRLDFSHGIPPSCRTMVVVPTMIGSVAQVEALLEKLDVLSLANRDEALQFGLLTDFPDAPEETGPLDQALLEHARRGIDALNQTWQAGPGTRADRFFLCHRPRLWNEGEGVWMGYERKRGKLAEFNGLLRGKNRDRFLLLAGGALTDPDGLTRPPVRYVITLDTDTMLPRDAARELVGAMAHPLNQPAFDSERQRVIAGYGILQPLVGVGLTSAELSPYARLFCCEAGIDPYTRSVSDVYQDLFGQGSFIGKGIYDVDAFERCTGQRFPDNRILSHDLIEGGFARSGLISDVQLYEGYPARYSADVRRRHRWIRGDWQLLPWLLPRVPRRGGGRERNPLSTLSRWKLFDNLRRSLAPPALLIMLITGWLIAPQPLLWTLGLAALLFAPSLADFITGLAGTGPGDSRPRALLHCLKPQLAREFLNLAWLPFEAGYCLDAIARTLWREGISHRHLLQWNPSHEAERTAEASLPGLYGLMWICPALAVTLAMALFRHSVSLAAAAPFLLLWIAAPALAWRLSLPTRPRIFAPTREQSRFLHSLARRIWAFFDHYVRDEDNWLPPDNIQESPVAAVAHRTSPTNMGLALLAHLAAHDFGYLSSGRMLERLERMLNAIHGLERYTGHLYNWYDTRTLKTLHPPYISTVDNGNLAGHLLTLRSGLLELADAPVWNAFFLPGLADTAELLDSALKAESPGCPAWRKFRKALDEARARSFPSLDEAADCLQGLRILADGLESACHADPDGEAAFWLAAIIRQCRDIHDDLRNFLPPAGVTLAHPDLAMPTLRQLAGLDASAMPGPARDRAMRVRELAAGRLAQAERLARQAAELADMDFRLLYDPGRDLLSIGYNVNERRRDTSCYDLLASEARLAYFVAIASGQLPQDSWFSLGRQLTAVHGKPVLLSWSGSMFEYLMPSLVMPGYAGSLLDSTCHGAVLRHIEYGHDHGVPWGISESCYNTLDAGLSYQYRAFGVPGLGFKPGLGDDMVIAPYASVMALMIEPEAACRNLCQLSAQGAGGRFGMYEAVDRTPARLPHGREAAVLPLFMSHHQGMSLLALDAVLRGNPMQRRFMADSGFQAVDLLLQERVPKAAPDSPFHAAASQTGAVDASARGGENRLRIYTNPNLTPPAVQLLSNGHYHVMISSAGGGWSRWRDLAVTRWREDSTLDNLGQFCYLRDTVSGEFWSTTCQPTCAHVEHFEAIFSDARAEFRVRHRELNAHTEIVVSPEDDVELRRLHITNRSRLIRHLELTTYAEVVMAPPAADAQHPAFSNLFVQTRILRPLQALLCTRRTRDEHEEPVWMCHLAAVHGADISAISYETDRARFIGRGRSLAEPAAMDSEALSDTAGAVLDPIVSIRVRLSVNPGQTVTVDLATGMSRSREDCERQIATFRDRRLADRVFDLAWTHSQVLLHQFNASLSDAMRYQELASYIVYADARLRAKPSVLAANMRSQSGLWGQSISGDLPIVLLKISNSANIGLAAQLVKAHAYWRHKGLAVDLVIWNEERTSYRQQLQDSILGLVPSGPEAHLLDRPGGIFVRPERQLSREERILIQAAARVILSDSRGTLEEQLSRRRSEAPMPARAVFRSRRPGAQALSGPAAPADAPAPDGLILRNPYGGFSPDGREYVITLREGQALPAPWVNVLANPGFGSMVSSSGGAYTWKENAHEFRLTPWGNDPVTDSSGEALYLRDEESGRCWSPTPLPRHGCGGYTIRHGFGYSVFEHRQDGLFTELTVYVARDDPVKFLALRVVNESGRPRRISVTGYVEWVLGDLRERTAMHVVTEADPVTGALFARNAYSLDFPGRTAFFDAAGQERSFTCDRREFIGRNRDLSAPAALSRTCLSGRAGPGLDPCAAIQIVLDVGQDESRPVVFLLGAARSVEEAARLAQRYRDPEAAAGALSEVRDSWHAILGSLSVSTPDPAFDVLANGWLLYQVIACRFWARSGYYQSGGAIGFRDQLQDSMAMIYALPDAARAHLLLCAGHQFPQGDVQHWWHPPVNRGVRTRCSDDYLWLPLAVCRYVEITGDRSVLDEQVPYIEGPAPAPDQESLYDLPIPSALVESVYQHCVRAVEHGLRRGGHGLPLMGSGDWNDGMNRVGEQGRGESVWLGFFQYDLLRRFAGLARLRGDEAFALRCSAEADALRENLEVHGWDGEWYRRAYFDDGTPLGSAQNEECRIDSLSQSWAVLSRAAPDWRQRAAMKALDEHLIRRDLGLIQLLSPPFDRSALHPGYIRGYVPGVRENGGQYTHAALWAIMAFAALGDADRAWALLNMVNPARHGDSAEAVHTYKVEPYVMSADVYAAAPHEGRGGWSWYTGAAGWMYRLMLESLLGLSVRGDRLRLEPLMPRDWPEFRLDYRRGSSLYHCVVTRVNRPQAGSAGSEPPRLLLDGRLQAGPDIPLVDDGEDHSVELFLPPA